MGKVFNWIKTEISRLRNSVNQALAHPLLTLEHLAQAAWRFIARAAAFIYIHTRWMTPRFWLITACILGFFVIATVSIYSALFMYVESRLVPVAQVDEVRLLGQGWTSAPDYVDRKLYYFTPQGAYLRDMRYDWLAVLERPWKRTRFAAPENMRAYGFVVEPAAMPENPGNLPIGFAPRYDAGYGELMLDVTCAACHTGELQYVKDGKRIGVRIDGGPAMHDLTSSRLGHFGTDLIASLTATYINPFKWSRFAGRILGDNNTFAARRRLHASLRGVIGNFLRQAWIDRRMKLYPVEEGYGRTDALGRISNNVFGSHLDPRNYRVANAPVSYPPVWNIHKFDWVQYNGSVRQPMARNIGESMGVGARYFLVDPYGRKLPASLRYEASTVVLNLHKIELALRRLEPPCWPEDVFGPVDKRRAQKGHDLFYQRCWSCHGPHPAVAAQVTAEAPGKIADSKDHPNVAHWPMTLIPVEEIGTDPTAALNFVSRRLDLSATGISAEEMRRTLAPFYTRYYERQKDYFKAMAASYEKRRGGKQSARYQQAWSSYEHLNSLSEEGYLGEQFAQLNMSSVSIGAGLNYLITFIRERAYQDLEVTGARRSEFDGYGQLDTPQVVAKYKARPLAGIWATAPFLHNGSVPSLYEMLLPVYKRPRKFTVRDRTFDPHKVGLSTAASASGAFTFDTSIPGNWNTGHEFRAGYRAWKEGNPPAWGVIGPELTDEERWAIVEYLKIRRDDPAQQCPVMLDHEFDIEKTASAPKGAW